MDSVHASNVIPIASLRALDQRGARKAAPAGDEGFVPHRDDEADETHRDAASDETHLDAASDERRRDLQLLALALQLTETEDFETAALRGAFARLLDDADEIDEAPASEH